MFVVISSSYFWDESVDRAQYMDDDAGESQLYNNCYARISRCLLHILLGIRGTDMDAFKAAISDWRSEIMAEFGEEACAAFGITEFNFAE